MRKAVLVVLLRLSLVVALFATVALFIEYQRAGDPAFCGAGSGCMAVRMSPYSRLLDVPLPTWGLLAFSGLFAAAMGARTRLAHALVAAVASAGALAALYLVYLQAFAIRAFCKWCVMADSSTLVAAVSAVLLYRYVRAGAQFRDQGTPNEAVFDEPERNKGKLDQPTSNEASLAELLSRTPVTLAWLAAAAVAVAAPFFWARYPVIPPLPPEITALQVPEKVTIVSFTDFECPYCRALHPTLDAILDHYAGKVVIVRKMMPLSGHPGAMPAALAYECTPPEKREAMVKELYEAPEQLLNREGVIAIAEARLGMSREALGACLDAPATRALVDADTALFREIHGTGLPQTYVGSRVVVGFKPDQVVEAVDRARAGPRTSLPLAALFALMGVVLAGAAGITLRSEKKSR